MGLPLPASSGPIWVVGLGPGDLTSASARALQVLRDPSTRVVCRTLKHPAAEQLAAEREVESTDDLYDTGATFEDVYASIVARILDAAREGPVAYAVPGGPLTGETAAGLIVDAARAAEVPVEIVSSESFVEASLRVLEHDALKDGLQVLDGRSLSDPLLLHLPTLIGHVDVPVVLADVIGRLQMLLPDEQPISVLTDLGSASEAVVTSALSALAPSAAGLRVSLFLTPVPNGLPGVIATMQRLRRECPWDASQTHASLLPNLVEEVYELYDAIEGLQVDTDAEPDWVGLAEVEEELGDVLLQVLFHSVIASESGALSVDSVAEQLRSKLVRRHPHVFADGTAGTPDEVRETWDEIKAQEKHRGSVLDGVAKSMPAIARAVKVQQRVAKVGFDWDELAPVIAKLHEELSELFAADTASDRADEFGDVIFSLVNVARHMGIDADRAARRGVSKFDERFRAMESLSGQELSTLSPDQLEELWERAKQSFDTGDSSVH